MNNTGDHSLQYQSDPALIKSFRGHKDRITQVTFNPNLKQLVSASTDGIVMTWGLRPNSRPQKFLGHKSAVYDVAVNPSGNQLASASKDSTIRLWNNNAEANSYILKGHSAPVKSVQFSCDGQLLLSASDDKTIKVILDCPFTAYLQIWSVADKRFSQTMKGHTNWVRKAQFAYDSRMIVSGSDDKTVRLWDINQGGQCIHSFKDHTGMVNDVKFHPDGTCVASSGSDKKIKIFDIRSHRLLQHYDAHSDLVNSIAFHPQGSYLLSTSNDGTLKVWDLRKGHILYTLYGHDGPTSSGNFSPAGDFFTTGGKDSVVLVWKSNLNPVQVEQLSGLSAKIQTEIYVTDKNEVEKLPSEKKQQENNSKINNIAKKRPQSAAKFPPAKKEVPSIPQINQNAPQLKPNNHSYKTLKPEVRATLDKIVYQVELVGKTLQLLEHRVVSNEDKMAEMMDFIRNQDLSYKPKFSGASMENQRPQADVSGQSLGHQVSSMNINEKPVEIAEGLRLATGGEDFFRSTNVFASQNLTHNP